MLGPPEPLSLPLLEIGDPTAVVLKLECAQHDPWLLDHMPRVAVSVGLGWPLEFAFLTCSEVMLILGPGTTL